MTSAKSRWALLVVAVALVATPAARADEGSKGIDIGLRVGLGKPFGQVDASTGDSLDQTFDFIVPLGVDVGYFVDPRLSIGLYGVYALGRPAAALSSDCSSQGVRCSLDDLRVGFQAQVHGLRSNPWDPWLGLGSGYEWAQVHTPTGSLAEAGWELLNLEAGIDLRPIHAAGIGPFVAWTVGEYDFESLPGHGQTAVPNRALHEWLMFGLRGTLDIAFPRTHYPAPAVD
jgi:hypothetical protein